MVFIPVDVGRPVGATSSAVPKNAIPVRFAVTGPSLSETNADLGGVVIAALSGISGMVFVP